MCHTFGKFVAVKFFIENTSAFNPAENDFCVALVNNTLEDNEWRVNDLVFNVDDELLNTKYLTLPKE